MRIHKCATSVIVLGTLILLSACDPNKMANDFFTNLGLNRLAILRTDIAPGAVYLSDGTKVMYAGNISHYVNAVDMPKAADNSGAAGDFHAVVPKLDAKKGLDASNTLKFLDTVLPVSLSGSIKLNGTVTLDQVNAEVKRIEPDDLESLFGDPNKSGNLTKKFQDRWDGDSDVYIAYEVYSAKTFNLKTTSDTDISPELDVGKTKVIASGKAKFSITHTSTSELKIDGDTAYVFAVRTAKLEPRGGNWRIRIMRPAPNQGVGAKAAGDKFSALIHQYTPVISVEDRPNGLD